MNRKGFTELIVIGIIAVIVVAGVIGYFAWRNANNLNQPTSTQGGVSQSVATSTTSTTTAVTQSPASNTTSSTQASSTSGYFTGPMVGNYSGSCAFVTSSQAINSANWKTYTDLNCGFAVKYSSTNNSLSNLSGWQTYINNQYGFELKYPTALYKLTSSSSDEYTILDLESAPQGVSIRSGGAPDLSESQHGYVITLVYPYATSSFNIDQWLSSEENLDPNPADDEIIGPYPITVGGEPAYEFSYIGAGGGEPSVVVYHDGLVYQMEYDSNYPFDASVSNSSSAMTAEQNGYTVFDEMLKSMTFISRQKTFTPFPTTTSTVGWQTYTNQQYGLSIQYPPTMQNLVGLSSSSDQYAQCGIDDASTVGCLSYPQQQFSGTANFAGGFVSIGIVNTTSSQTCTTFSDMDGPSIGGINTLSINGINFYSESRVGLLFKFNSEPTDYRTYHNSTCLDIRSSVDTSGCSGTQTTDSQGNLYCAGLPAFSDANAKTVNSLLMQVVSTLKFSN